jgi:uncharacterized protein (DUF2267 family)
MTQRSNHPRASRATSSSVPGSSKRCVAPRHDVQRGLRLEARQRGPVHLDHGLVVATDDQERRRLHTRERGGGKVRATPAGHDGPHGLRAFDRGHERRRRAGACSLATRKDAERCAKAVAIALADLAPDSQTRRRFISQLPRVLKSALQAETPSGLMMDREALIQHVAAALDVHAPEGRRALLAVWGVIRRSVSQGEIAAFQAHLPRDIAALLEVP